MTVATITSSIISHKIEGAGIAYLNSGVECVQTYTRTQCPLGLEKRLSSFPYNISIL